MPKRTATPMQYGEGLRPDHPRREAAHLFSFVQRGIDTPESIRELVRVSPEDEKVLRANFCAGTAAHAIKYRQEILREFEKLIAAGAQFPRRRRRRRRILEVEAAQRVAQ